MRCPPCSDSGNKGVFRACTASSLGWTRRSLVRLTERMHAILAPACSLPPARGLLSVVGRKSGRLHGYASPLYFSPRVKAYRMSREVWELQSMSCRQVVPPCFEAKAMVQPRRGGDRPSVQSVWHDVTLSRLRCHRTAKECCLVS
jgi:hypothetical protein